MWMIYTKLMGRKPLGRERINITLAAGIPNALTEVASEQGRDRSSLLDELARDYLKKLGRFPVSKKAKGVK